MIKKGIMTGVMALLLGGVMCFTAFAGEWVEDSSGWWFRNSDGSFPSNGIYEIGGKKYAFNDSGYLVQDNWYQHPETGDWYYASGSGALASDQWVGDYYMGSDGAMATDTWVDGYYVGGDGKWVEGATKSSSSGSSYSSYDEYGDVHNPFRDAPLGYGYDHSSSSSTSYNNDLETKEIWHHSY